jgi:hypothetical protein
VNWQGKSMYSEETHVNFASNIISSTVLLDVTPCSLVVYRYFGRTYCLHFHGRLSQASNLFASFLPHSSTLKMEAVSYSKRRLTSTRLHAATSRKIVFFVVITVRTSNVTMIVIEFLKNEVSNNILYWS